MHCLRTLPDCGAIAGSALKIVDGRVEVTDEAALRDTLIDQLVRSATFGAGAVKEFAQWLIWETGQALGARPASIHELYMAAGRGEWTTGTVPAMNIRFTNYEPLQVMDQILRLRNKDKVARSVKICGLR